MTFPIPPFKKPMYNSANDMTRANMNMEWAIYFDRLKNAESTTYTANGTGAITRTIESKFDDYWIDVKDYGALGDGVDDTAAIQRAIDVACVSGGTVFFPTPGIYAVKSEITVNSDYPVSLYSNMSLSSIGGKSYISIGGTIGGSVFKFTTFDGGLIDGLYFFDPTGTIATNTQGTRSVTAALELSEFHSGTVRNCYFDCILGSGIKVFSSSRPVFDRIHMRACGDTSKPAMYYAATSGYYVQAGVLSNSHFEVCYSAPYIYLGQYAYANKIIGVQCEADTSKATSNQYFVYNNGVRNTIDAFGFNRNTGTSLYNDTSSYRTAISNCHFQSEPSGAPKFYNAGYDCVMSNSTLVGGTGDTGTSIENVGTRMNFSNVYVYYGGNVKLGTYATWTGGQLHNLKTTEDYSIVIGNYSTVIGANIYSNAVPGGIHVTGAAARILGNMVVGNGGIGIYNESSTSLIEGNYSADNTGDDYSSTSNANVVINNNFTTNRGLYHEIVGNTLGWAAWFKNSDTGTNAYGLLVNGGKTYSDYSMRLKNAADDTELLSVKGNGFTGIGTNLPTGFLHVKSIGTTSPVAIIQKSASGPQDFIQFQDVGGNILSAFVELGAWSPPLIADASAPTGTLYFSTDQNALVFKDYTDDINLLYVPSSASLSPSKSPSSSPSISPSESPSSSPSNSPSSSPSVSPSKSPSESPSVSPSESPSSSPSNSPSPSPSEEP